MKNNKSLKVACGLLVMVLLTTCVIGTTLARYTTSDTASDTARVAKWGLEVSTSGTLFGNSYEDEIVNVTDTGLTVQSYNAAANVVAPGTQNSTGFQIRLVGQPEVDFQVLASSNDVEDIYLAAGTYGVMVEQYGLNDSSDVTGLYTYASGVYTEVTAAAWDSSETYYKLMDSVTIANRYNPIVWTGVLEQNGTPYTTTYNTLVDATNALVGYINGYNTTNGASYYETNHDLEDIYTITWAWDFGTTEFGTPDNDDKCDTILGNLIADAGETNVVVKTGSTYSALSVANGEATVGTTVYANLEVACGITVTATQVD